MAEPATLTIRQNFERAPAAIVEALRGAPTGFVVDALGRSGALSRDIAPVWDGGVFIGPALTVWTTPRDNLAPYAALRHIRPGDVVVVATGQAEGFAVLGDLIIGMMRNAGAVAVVTDGLVRDVPGIREVGIPVYARGVTPNSPFKNGPGGIGVQVALGGSAIDPGDIVLGDSEGVVVVPRGRGEEAVRELTAVRAKEAEMEAAVRAGLAAPPWLDAALAKATIRHLD